MPPPPWANPWAFDFFEKFCSNFLVNVSSLMVKCPTSQRFRKQQIPHPPATIPKFSHASNCLFKCKYPTECTGNTVKPLLSSHPREFARRLLNRGFLKLRPQCDRNCHRGQNLSLYLQQFIVHNNSNGKLKVLRSSHLTTELNLA